MPSEALPGVGRDSGSLTPFQNDMDRNDDTPTLVISSTTSFVPFLLLDPGSSARVILPHAVSLQGFGES